MCNLHMSAYLRDQVHAGGAKRGEEIFCSLKSPRQSSLFTGLVLSSGSLTFSRRAARVSLVLPMRLVMSRSGSTWSSPFRAWRHRSSTDGNDGRMDIWISRRPCPRQTGARSTLDRKVIISDFARAAGYEWEYEKEGGKWPTRKPCTATGGARIAT